MTTSKFPKILVREVAHTLRNINANVESFQEDGCPVRLQVYDDGRWIVHWGLSDYDQDHRGYWGASFVPGVVKGTVQRFNSIELACDLIEQCEDHFYQCH